MKRSIGSRYVHTAQGAHARPVRRASGPVRISKAAPRPPAAAQPDADGSERVGRTEAPRRRRSGAHLLGAAVSVSGLERFRLSVAELCACLVAGAALAAHWIVPAGFWQLIVACAPLVLLAIARQQQTQRLQWAMYAGLLWLTLAWAGLVHPASGSRPELHRLLELTVLAVILFQLREGAEHMQHLSQRDPLTGLLNRRGFEEHSAAELQRSARYQRPIAFALLDVDRFKAVNDRFGHAAGDRVLRIVSDELLKLRTSDLAVRLGGDEFGLLMPETDALGAEQLVARLRQTIHRRLSEQGWPVTVSAGVAASSSCPRRLSELITEADRRMYSRKAAFEA